MPSVFPVGFSLIIPAESSFPSSVISKSVSTLELPGELLTPTGARAPPETNRFPISEGGAQAPVVWLRLPDRVALCSQVRNTAGF